MRWEVVIRQTYLSAAHITLVLASIAVPARCMAQRTVSTPVEDRARAIECLTLAVAYEAGHESLAGKEAVAQVVLNRVLHPAFPKTVCDVVFAGSTRRTGCQFSFTCDGSMRRRLSDRTMAAARDVAIHAMDGFASPPVSNATHYHAAYVSPYWAPDLLRLTQIGLHIFYRAHAKTKVLPGAVVAGIGESATRGASDKLSAARQPATPFAPWGIASPVAAASDQ